MNCSKFQIVHNSKQFKDHFNTLTNGMLENLNYKNIFIAGGSILCALSKAVDENEENFGRYEHNSARFKEQIKKSFLHAENIPTTKSSLLKIKSNVTHTVLKIPLHINVLLSMFNLNCKLLPSKKFFPKNDFTFNGMKVYPSVQYFLSTNFITNDFQFESIKGIQFFSLDDFSDKNLLSKLFGNPWVSWKLKKKSFIDFIKLIFKEDNFIPIAHSNEYIVYTMMRSELFSKKNKEEEEKEEEGEEDEDEYDSTFEDNEEKEEEERIFISKNFPVYIRRKKDLKYYKGPISLSNFLQNLKNRVTNYPMKKKNQRKRFFRGREIKINNYSEHIRKYYKNSDIDIFLYDLTPAQANKKIAEIYETIMSNIQKKNIKDEKNQNKTDILVYRSKYAVTFQFDKSLHSIQIILRLYKSPAEVLLGFDVDSCCLGYDGSNVWCTDRSKRALKEGYNLVDNSRQSTTYVKRLFKYAKRGFKIAVPGYNKKFVKRQGLINSDGIENYDYDITPNERTTFGLGKLILLYNLYKFNTSEDEDEDLKELKRLRNERKKESDYNAGMILEPSYLKSFCRNMKLVKSRMDEIFEKKYKFEFLLRSGKQIFEQIFLKNLYKSIKKKGSAHYKKILINKSEEEDDDDDNDDEFKSENEMDMEELIFSFFERIRWEIHNGNVINFLEAICSDGVNYLKLLGNNIVDTRKSKLDRIGFLNELKGKFIEIIRKMKMEYSEVLSLDEVMKRKIEEDNKIKARVKYGILYSVNDIKSILKCEEEEMLLKTSLPKEPIYLMNNPGTQGIPKKLVESEKKDEKKKIVLMTGSFHPIQKLNFFEDAYLSHEEIVEKKWKERKGNKWIWLFEALSSSNFQYEKFLNKHSKIINDAYEKKEKEVIYRIGSLVVFHIDFERMKVISGNQYCPNNAKIKRVKSFYYWK